jgi:hypothetical protein
LGVGRLSGRNGQGGDGGQRHQCLPHGITFLIESDCTSAAFQGPNSTVHLNDQ